MSVINKSAIVFFSAKKMFNLVDSIEEYPQFLSWCGRTKIIERDSDFTTASIEIAYKGINQTFTTKNTKKKFDEMVMTLVDGPFKKLSGVWKFKRQPSPAPRRGPHHDPSAARPHPCTGSGR